MDKRIHVHRNASRESEVIRAEKTQILAFGKSEIHIPVFRNQRIWDFHHFATLIFPTSNISDLVNDPFLETCNGVCWDWRGEVSHVTVSAGIGGEREGVTCNGVCWDFGGGREGVTCNVVC